MFDKKEEEKCRNELFCRMRDEKQRIRENCSGERS